MTPLESGYNIGRNLVYLEYQGKHLCAQITCGLGLPVPPSLNDSAFETWSSKGLQTLKDLFIDGIFASFSQLTDQFNIPGTHFICRYAIL